MGEIDSLVSRFGLDAGHLADAMDDDEMPRLEREGDTTYIFIRYAYRDAQHNLTTLPLLFVIGPELCLTIARQNLPFLQRFTTGEVSFSTPQRSRLVLQIVSQVIEQYEEYANGISRQIKTMRTRLRNHDVEGADFVDFVLIEDELNEYLSALLPMTAILKRLLLGRYMALADGDSDLVEDLLLNAEQSIEGCQSSIKSIVNIREAYATIASNNLNRTMKVLTIATVMIALPNLFFSMYGMNVTTPFHQENWAWLFVVFLSILTSVVVFFAARHKRIL
jgi:magnesium transporter